MHQWIEGGFYNNNGLSFIMKPANFHDNSYGTGTSTKWTSGVPKDLKIWTQSSFFPVLLPSSIGGTTSTYLTDTWECGNASLYGITCGGGGSTCEGIFHWGAAGNTTSATIGARAMVLP